MNKMKEISFKDRDAIFGRLIARKMKAKGQPTDFIADITGLTIEEIEKL